MDSLELRGIFDAERAKRQVYIGNMDWISIFSVPELKNMLVRGKEDFIAVL